MNADDRKEFLARWIPVGMGLIKKAEVYGIDWRNMPVEKLGTAIIFEESYSNDEKEVTGKRKF